MTEISAQVAQRLIAGGKLWVAGDWGIAAELTSRAGGMMMARMLYEQIPSQIDAVLNFDTGKPGSRLNPKNHPLIITFGQRGTKAHFEIDAGRRDISPRVAGAVLGWLFMGELIAALTRHGKMPVLYESVGLVQGFGWIQKFKNGEIPFHINIRVPPIPAGVLGARFLDEEIRILDRIEREQYEKIRQAANWSATARRNGGRTYLYTMGHLVPHEMTDSKIGSIFTTAVWNSGDSLAKPPNDKYSAGDVLIHLGYQLPPDSMLSRALSDKAKVVYISILAHRDYTKDPNVIWIDPQWPWSDAIIPIDGYHIPALASSGIINSTIGWEIYRLSFDD